MILPEHNTVSLPAERIFVLFTLWSFIVHYTIVFVIIYVTLEHNND